LSTPPPAPLCPYPTLFRSGQDGRLMVNKVGDGVPAGPVGDGVSAGPPVVQDDPVLAVDVCAVLVHVAGVAHEFLGQPPVLPPVGDPDSGASPEVLPDRGAGADLRGEPLKHPVGDGDP